MAMMALEHREIPDAALPVAELAAQMRLADGFGDVPGQTERLQLRLRTAISAIEARLGRLLFAREVVLSGTVDRGMSVRLPVGPLREVLSVERIAGDGATVLEGAMAGFDPLTPEVMLAAPVPSGTTLRIAVIAGFGAWADMPGSLAQAVLLLAEAFDEGEERGLPRRVEALTAPWRVIRIGGNR